MQPFTILHGIAAPMFVENIDTDAITPAAAGKSTSVDLGAMLFNNIRYDLQGNEDPEFVLNRPRFRQAEILVAGRNFGCGSSRERAVWALMQFGIRCVIAPSFADIFYDNAFQNGLLPVSLDQDLIQDLAATLEHADDPTMTVDLTTRRIMLPSGLVLSFDISDERRDALLKGLDQMSLILSFEDQIEAFAEKDVLARPWLYTSKADQEAKISS